MLDIISFTSIILFLSIFQTIAGVGILVLGTPILLLLGLEMVDVMTLLLPLSILNSFTNIFYLKHKIKGIQIDSTMRNYFFLLCLPGIFLGLFILKLFVEYLNFNILVSLAIWIFLIFSYLRKKKISIFQIYLKKT